jgi:hypothetical protein
VVAGRNSMRQKDVVKLIKRMNWHAARVNVFYVLSKATREESEKTPAAYEYTRYIKGIRIVHSQEYA